MKSSTHNMNTRINTFNAIAYDSSLYLQGFLLRTVRELRTVEIVADFRAWIDPMVPQLLSLKGLGT